MAVRPLFVFVSIGLLIALPGTTLVEAQEQDQSDEIVRIVMLPPEAEATGMFVDEQGRFFVNAMHPDPDDYKATIGVINGIDWNSLSNTIPSLDSSSQPSDVWHGIRTSSGEYQVLLQSGDLMTDGTLAGGIYSVDDGQQILLSEKPDFNAFVPTEDNGSRGFLYTAWEDRPAGLSQIQIEWNMSSNQWDVLDSQMLNLSKINGAWVLCFGSVSPWGTPLFSEELYFDDTENWNNPNFRYHSDQLRLERYLGYYPNPYDYGFIIEMNEATTTTPELVRHLAMGRFSHENALVMPDHKTVYLTDDGYETVLFKFVADVPGDLTEGTLFAAKLIQDGSWDASITGFDTEWIELASASNADVQSWIDEYDGISTTDYVEGENAYITDEEINNWAEGRLNQDLNNDGIVGYALDDRVAFLESRKAAAAIGATDEWNKMEGVAFNENAPEHMYLAMSNIGNAMTDGQGDIDVSLNSCGIVYRMATDNQWDVHRIEPAIVGGPYLSSAEYKCSIDNLAGPDNILVLDDGSVLVGEDTRYHKHNMVWLWREFINPVVEVDEQIRITTLNLSDNPSSLVSPWTYSYQAVVDDLAFDTTYTAIVVAKNISSGEWSGVWWWNDISETGQQYNLQISLNRGCYMIETTLYEKDDLDVDAGNATVLSSVQRNLTVGNGDCVDGTYTEAVEVESVPEDTIESNNAPGFAFTLLSASICLGLFFANQEREHTCNNNQVQEQPPIE